MSHSVLHRVRRSHLLIKDPFVFFSTPWMADRFGARPVIMIRHPAGFASSLHSLGWRFDFKNWLEQPLLMEHHLDSLRPEIEDFARKERDPIEQATLIWRAIYGTALNFRQARPDWLFVRYEDLAVDPMRGFARLYKELGLQYDERAERSIAEHSKRGRASPPATHEIQRDSKAAAVSWRTRLRAAEVELIRERVGELSSHYYDAESWESSGAP
jgi:hypothetical protein